MVTFLKRMKQIIAGKLMTTKFNLVALVFSCTIFFVGLTKVNAQVSVYTFSESLSAYAPLSGSLTVAYAAPWDDHVTGAIHQATIPFTFDYDGVSYTDCFISPNGFITFGTTQPASINYLPLSTAGTPPGVISAFGINLASNGFDIVYDVVGVAPNREFVIEWKDAVRVASPTGNYNFQIRLQETSNTVSFSYGVCSTTSTTSLTVQVGLRGPNNTVAQGNINNRQMPSLPGINWFSPNTITGIFNASAVKTSNLAYPDLGLYYLYTPASPCVTPTGFPTALVLGATSITHNAITGNSFTAASPPATNYLVLRSTVNTVPTALQVPNRTFGVVGNTMAGIYTVVSISSATTFTQTGLLPDTTYYYWVIPYNGNCFGAPFYNVSSVLAANATTCSTPTVASPATAIGGNNFIANWSAVAGATDYRIDVATNTTFLALVPGYSNVSVGNVTTFPITGLASITTYYYRVRAIGIGCTVNSNTITVATICGSYPIPYTQNFDTTGIGLVPNCYTRVDNNADTVQWGTQSVTFASSPKSLFIGKNTTQAMDDWFFLPGLNLNGGTSYRLFFRYRTNGSATITENLKISLGNGQAIASMTQTLLDLANLNNTVFKPVFVDFTPVTSGVYYLGFEGYSVANQSYLAIDDISVTVSPTCFEPTDLIASAIGITTATVSWTPPLIEPANGFEYYLSTSITPPTAATTPTGSVGSGVYTVNLVGLTASTSYYIWVRGNCGISDKSIWSLEEFFSTECNTPAVSSTTPGNRCGFGTVTLNALPNTGSVINWYDSATGGTLLATGSTYTTPNINTTTTYYAEAKAFGAIAKAGPTSPLNEGGLIGVQNFQAAVNFSVSANTSLQTVDIFPYASGQSGQVTIRNSLNVTLATIPFTTTGSGGTILQSLPIGFALLPGNYNLYLSIVPASGLAMNTTNAFYSYTTSVASITGNDLDNTQYLGFYNFKFTTECLSGRIPVTATVAVAPSLTISNASSIICENETTPLITVSGYGAYNTLVWTPNTNITGSFATGFTFNPTSTTVYTLNANQTSGSFCSAVLTHTVTVNPVPPAVMIVPNNATLCENSIQSLNGTVGASSAATILYQNFEGPTNNWTVAHTSLLGDIEASKWTLRQSPYTYASVNWNVIFKSNDNSQFYLANADAQGSGSLTRTTLTSPSFSLAGYVSASLNFWHYIRFPTSTFFVQVSTDSGASWTTIQQYTASQGTALAFTNPTLSLNAFIGNPNVTIRFNFTSNWGYGWAMDNVTVAGTLALALSWSPATYLYTDALATVPYTLGDAVSVVYVKPTTTTTYTATATGSNTCTSSATTTITVDALPVGGTITGSQALCSGTAISNLTLTGYTGNIIRWEYADNAAFTINLTTIPNITPILTPAQMGVITTVRYFRAVLGNGICSNVYSTVASVDFPSSTWNGTTWSNGVPTAAVKAIFTNNFSSTTDLTACSVQVLSGLVIINSNHNLIVGNEVTVTSGTLIFENNASLVQINSVANTGNITYKRTTMPMRRFDFTYWSTPVLPQTLFALSPSTTPSKFFEWRTSAVPFNWSFVPGSTTMQRGKGYIVRVPNSYDLVTTAVYNGAFIGVPNNGTITTPITVSGTNRLNLIGNPYPSALSADLFLSDSANAPVMDATIYLWTHNTPYAGGVYANNDYAVYNYMGGTGTRAALSTGINNSVPQGKIAAGQGFFIKGIVSGNATFKNSMRMIGFNDQFFRMNSTPSNETIETERHRFWLDIASPEGHYKQCLLGYIENATNDIDRGFDSEVFDAGNPIMLYSIVIDKKLSIQGKPLPFDSDEVIPMGYKSTITGVFTISLSNFDGLFNLQNIYLEDTVLGVIHDLKTSDYSFTTEIGTFDTRFKIRYTSVTLNIDTPNFDENALVIYGNATKWHVTSTSSSIETLQVFDIRGRLLLEQKAINSNHTEFFVGVTNQVLLVKIISQEGKSVIKKITN